MSTNDLRGLWRRVLTTASHDGTSHVNVPIAELKQLLDALDAAQRISDAAAAYVNAKARRDRAAAAGVAHA